MSNRLLKYRSIKRNDNISPFSYHNDGWLEHFMPPILWSPFRCSPKSSSSKNCFATLALQQQQKEAQQQKQWQEQREKKISNRMKFNDIPVNNDILQYIERIGVGRVKTDRYGRRRRGRKNQNEFDSLLSAGRRNYILEPPLPFSKGGGDSKKRVEVIGSVGSIEETFPPNYKNRIAEVAIAGRSNVGKSTLLNALLYGNQSIASFTDLAKKRGAKRRGKTPLKMKLPKGVKAITSAKPGETRRVTFYNISSLVTKRENKNLEVERNNKDNKRKQKGIPQKIENTKKLSYEQQEEQDRLEQEIVKQQLRIVDLPGYGFAFQSSSPSSRKNDNEEDAEENSNEYTNTFHPLINQYILHRGKALKRVLLLIDARHGMKKADFIFLRSLQEEQRNFSANHNNDGKNKKKDNRSHESDFVDEHGSNQKTSHERKQFKKKYASLPPIQIVLTKCDLVPPKDLARRVVLIRENLSDALRRETSLLPIMMVSAKIGIGFNNIEEGNNGNLPRAMGGILELQKELAALSPQKSVTPSKEAERKEVEKRNANTPRTSK